MMLGRIVMGWGDRAVSFRVSVLFSLYFVVRGMGSLLLTYDIGVGGRREVGILCTAFRCIEL